MDCYRLIGDDNLAENACASNNKEVDRCRRHDISPIRKAEAELTLGVVAARHGTVDDALGYGHKALSIDRRSQPTLLMVGSELDRALRQRYPDNAGVQQFHRSLNEIAAATGMR